MLQHGLASTVMIGIDVALGTAALVVGMITAPVGTLVVLTCGAFAATFSFGLSWVGLHGDVALAQKSVGRWDRASELEVERRYYKEAIDELDRLEPALARAEVRALVALGLFLFGILTLLVW